MRPAGPHFSPGRGAAQLLRRVQQGLCVGQGLSSESDIQSERRRDSQRYRHTETGVCGPVGRCHLVPGVDDEGNVRLHALVHLIDAEQPLLLSALLYISHTFSYCRVTHGVVRGATKSMQCARLAFAGP